MALPAPIHRRTYTQAAGTSRRAVASLVLGILSLLSLLPWISAWSMTSLLSWIPAFSFGQFGWFGLFGPILALVFGYVAKGRIDRSGGTLRGRGLAISGIVLGWIGVGVQLLTIVLFALAWRGGGSWGA